MGLGFLPELTETTGTLLLGAVTAEQMRRDTAVCVICMLEKAHFHIYSMGLASTLSYLVHGP